MMLFFYRSRAFFTIVLLFIIQSVIYAQNDKILIVNHAKVSSSSEVNKLLKNEISTYIDKQKVEIRDNYKKRKDWYRLTAEQKKTECKVNNISSVIEIRERKSNTKTITYAKITKWDYDSPIVKPNEITYNWQEGGDLSSYYIDKAAYFAIYGKEKKDVVIIRFKYTSGDVNSWEVRQAVMKLHNDLASTLPMIDNALERKYVFKKMEQKIDNAHIYITGEASPEGHSIIKLQLEMENNTKGKYARENCVFSYDFGKLEEFKAQVADKILQVAKDEGILEF